MFKRLAKFKKNRCLVSIRRENINDLMIQGFILGYSDDLILLQYVYDFTLDGLMVLRLCDITDIHSYKKDVVQTEMLKKEGVYSDVDFTKKYSIDDWEVVFSTIGKEYGFCIIEDENPDYPVFLLGELRSIGKKSVSILGFSGAASWDDGVTEMNYSDISSFQVGNNYATVYERHAREALLSG